MANRSITSSIALHTQQLVVTEVERRTWDWEVVEDEDLYSDVQSLESFSISSGDGQDEREQHRDEQDLEVASTQIHHRIDYSANFREHDVVGEAVDRVVFPLVDPLGFNRGSLDLSIGEEYSKDLEIQEDGDGSEYESDVDDELVPRGVSDRLDKQRMRKLGKRSCARMNKSKKMAHLYTKSACLHGKHGLGLKAY